MSVEGTGIRTIRLRVNGESVRAQIENHHTLVELLQGMGLHGARESCAQGLCGCCTVLVDGSAVSACLYLAAFAECGAFQCGFCTPGFVLMSRQLIARHPDPSEDDIRHYLAGNLCRCAAYPEIVRAVQLAARRMRGAA